MQLPWSAFALAPEGQALFFAGHDGVLHAWRTSPRLYNERDAERAQRTFTAHSASVHEVAVSPDGSLVATASRDGTARVWSAAALGALDEEYSAPPEESPLPPLPAGANALLREDGEALALAPSEEALSVWSPREGLLRFPALQPPEGDRRAAVAALGGRRLAYAGYDRRVAVALAGVESPLLRLEGHAARVRALRFSPSRERLASLDQEGSLWLWDLSAELPLARVRVPPGGDFAWQGETLQWTRAGEAHPVLASPEALAREACALPQYQPTFVAAQALCARLRGSLRGP